MDRPFVVDPALSAISIGYRNPASAYIADDVLPRVPVGGEQFKWNKFALEESFNIPDARVGRKGRVQQLEFSSTEESAMVEDFGLDSPIPNSDIEAARVARQNKTSNYDPEAHAAMMLTDTLLNIREVRVAGIVHNPDTYAAGRKVTLAGTSQISDYENSDPIGVIKTGMDGTLVVRPNTMVLGRPVWSKISSHPNIVNAVKGGVAANGMVTLEQFTELFRGEGIQRVLVGDAWYNTAKPGKAAVLSRAWGKHIALIHLNPIANPEGGGVTFGYTAQYGTRLAGRIEDPDIGLQGGFRIRAGERVKEVIAAQDAGYLIQNAVA